MDRRWECGLATGVPTSFCLSRCFGKAQDTSLGDERIYLSGTELAERMKWIWLETGRGWRNIGNISARLGKHTYRARPLVTGVQSNHVRLNENYRHRAADTHTHTSGKGDSACLHTNEWISFAQQFSICLPFISSYLQHFDGGFALKKNLSAKTTHLWPILLHYISSVYSYTCSPVSRLPGRLLTGFLQTCLSMKFYNIHCGLGIMWSEVWILTVILVSWVMHIEFMHLPMLKLSVINKWEKTVCGRKGITFCKGADIRERHLWKWKSKKKIEWVKMLLKYTLIYFGSPNLYKVMTAANSVTFWFNFIWRETTERGSTRGSHIKCIVWRRGTMQ